MKIKNLYEFDKDEAEKKLAEYLSKETDRDVEVKIIDIINKEYWEVKEVNKKTSEILDECRSKFNVYSSYDNKQLNKYFPIPEMTTRKFKANIEADEDLRNMSADDLEKKGIKGITLRERLILELQYFNETGKHLDINNWTLCSGSRDSGGFIPYVYWYSSYGRLYVRWCGSDDSGDVLRSRAGVS
jgi:hypothetical protein